MAEIPGPSGFFTSVFLLIRKAAKLPDLQVKTLPAALFFAEFFHLPKALVSGPNLPAPPVKN
jgi:hypothetical protein